MKCDEVKPLLHARMDGELNAAQNVAVDSHSETCASCTADRAAIERVRSSIRGEMQYYKAPARLRNRVTVAIRGAGQLDHGARGTDWRAWGAMAAGLILVALGTAPFLVNARNERQLVADELLSAHVRAMMGRSLDVVSSDQHNVKPWFSGKLPFSPPVADLSTEGFPLQGGRLDYAAGRPLAALVYSRRLHRIDLFIWPSGGQVAPPSHFERDGYNEISWMKSNFIFTAVSDLNAAELNAFASLLRK